MNLEARKFTVKSLDLELFQIERRTRFHYHYLIFHLKSQLTISAERKKERKKKKGNTNPIDTTKRKRKGNIMVHVVPKYYVLIVGAPLSAIFSGMIILFDGSSMSIYKPCCSLCVHLCLIVQSVKTLSKLISKNK